MALGWAPYDALPFDLVGMASFAGAIVLVNQPRPTLSANRARPPGIRSSPALREPR